MLVLLFLLHDLHSYNFYINEDLVGQEKLLKNKIQDSPVPETKVVEYW